MKFIEQALVFGLLAAGSVGCLDPEPVNVERKDQVTASAACLKCLSTPDVPGPGCADEVAACRAAQTCSRGYDCSFQRGCVGGTIKTFVACLPACTLAAGFMSQDDPGRIAGLRIYECLTRGGCSSVCFTDSQGDAGPPQDASDASDASVADQDAGTDAGLMNACLNPADQSVLSDMQAVTDAAQACGTACFPDPNPNCNAECMVMRAGLTPGCASCYGDSIKCAAANCLIQCISGNEKPECRACSEQYCTPAFRACSGLP
jgi:hypothetical protein